MNILSFKDHLQVFQSMDSLQIEGMKNLLVSLNTFLDNTFLTSINNESLYKSATLQSTDIIHADSSYNNDSWFSNVAIVMDTNKSTYYNTDQRTCFGKVLLLDEFYVNNSLKTAIFAFTMVKWYDYCEQNEADPEPTEIYGCPRLMMLQDYSIVPLNSISHAVHIIPRFHKKNQFLMNRYLF
ncbi:zn-finger domain-containing protein [Gigaspora margarita]|uniref:Zn-finger domain-containing protein n=1 Tax=Gigaspora margarita TaxID=4874 RepID=A0A8H3X3Q7_GIGMA|nr:zn-finger domain-containing protein [Gigaspora margarita]